MLDHAVAEGFLRPAHRDLVIADSDVDALLLRLAAFVPVPVGKWANAKGNFS
jgi:hypothetical protein